MMVIFQSKEVIPSQWLEKQKLVDKITGLEQRESNLERSIRKAEHPGEAEGAEGTAGVAGGGSLSSSLLPLRQGRGVSTGNCIPQSRWMLLLNGIATSHSLPGPVFHFPPLYIFSPLFMCHPCPEHSPLLS